MKQAIRFLMANMMAMMADKKIPDDVKRDQARLMNTRAGGLLFSSSPIPHRYFNQRQHRKHKSWAGKY